MPAATFAKVTTAKPSVSVPVLKEPMEFEGAFKTDGKHEETLNEPPAQFYCTVQYYFPDPTSVWVSEVSKFSSSSSQWTRFPSDSYL